MLTTEIKINGSIIAHLYLHNNISINEYGQYEYYWEYYEVNRQCTIKSGIIYHDRSEGAAVLVRDILKEITKEG